MSCSSIGTDWLIVELFGVDLIVLEMVKFYFMYRMCHLFRLYLLEEFIKDCCLLYGYLFNAEIRYLSGRNVFDI